MEVDYPRVTHPFAGLLTLAGFLPRLACVRHAASVRSEPGSNSPIISVGVIPVLTYFVHSKHCGFRNLLLGPAIQFSRTERHCPPRTTDCEPPSTTGRGQRNFPARVAAPSRCLPPRRGALCTSPELPCQAALLCPPSTPGTAAAAGCSRGDRACQRARSGQAEVRGELAPAWPA